MSDTFEFDLKQLLAEAANNRHTSTFTPFEDGGRETGATVSPKDVFNNDSVPPSTSFTNLTTPGSTYLETPEEEFQTSPLFSDNLGYGGGNQNDNWFPLFPDTDATPAPPTMERTISASSAAQVMVHPGGESLHRKRSSTTTSPTFSPVVKHSSVAGVAARKRDKPLPPIMVDDSDPVAMKRARNTAAARKSRAKKVAEREDLEAEIADLKSQVEHWKAIALGQSLPAAEEEGRCPTPIEDLMMNTWGIATGFKLVVESSFSSSRKCFDAMGAQSACRSPLALRPLPFFSLPLPLPIGWAFLLLTADSDVSYSATGRWWSDRLGACITFGVLLL